MEIHGPIFVLVAILHSQITISYQCGFGGSDGIKFLLDITKLRHFDYVFLLA